MSVTMDPSGDPLYHLPNGTVYVAGGTNANCTLAVCPLELSVYGYRPSIGASGALIALYAICILVQGIMGWRYKSWGYMSAMMAGCVDEILGYLGRIMYWHNPWNHAGFILQIVTITIGPVFFSAAIYVLLYQIVHYISAKHSRFPPKAFYYIFIPCDILSLILQAAGGALSSGSSGASNTGVNIALAGLGFQVATLTVFIVLTADYFFRSRSVWAHDATIMTRKFTTFVTFLALACILILIRCCYRIDELSGGYSRNSSSLRDQGLFIGLESVMVILAAYALIIAHPGPVFGKGGWRRSDDTEKSKLGDDSTFSSVPQAV